MSREIVYRSCSFCEAHCGVAIEVDRPARRVITVRGDRDDPASGGYICPKAYGMKGLFEDPDRLRKPLIRENGAFRETDMEEALDRAAAGLARVREENGENAVATYLGNPNIHDYASMLVNPTLQRALGTKWRFSATSVDQLPKVVSAAFMFGSPSLLPVPDIDRTDFFLVLGANPLASNGSLMTAPDFPGRLRALRERGGTLIVLDPRRSETAEAADEHHFLRPGGDAFFLLGALHTLFAEGLAKPGRLDSLLRNREQLEASVRAFSPEAVSRLAGIGPESIRDLARRFAGAKRAVCYGRMGTTTQAFGSLASWLVDALNIVTGNLDEPGGAMFSRTAHESARGPGGRSRPVPLGRWRTRVRGLPEFAGELPAAALSEEMDTPGPGQVRGLLTIAGNPVLSTPNAGRLESALENLSFMVSIDLYLNETSRHADVILPTTTVLERENYGLAFHAQAVRNFAKCCTPVFEPEEGLLHPWQVSLELAARLRGETAEALANELIAGTAQQRGATAEGALEDANLPERMLDLLLRSGGYAASHGISLATLREKPHGIDLGPLEARLPEALATDDGCIDVAPEALRAELPRLSEALAEDLPDLVMVGRRHIRSNNSWFHNLPALAKGKTRCTLRMHPSDAARRSLVDGSDVWISSRVGKLRVRLEIGDEMMPGVVSLPHGFGHDGRETRLAVATALQPGANANALNDDDRIDALSGTAAFSGLPVTVEAA
jgi:anaerobic selenocysteine-containing dehydrogenase